MAFFDLEIAQPKTRISSMGALYQEQTWHGRTMRDFELFTQPAAYLCGHNIFDHDLPHLEKAGISAAFLNKNFIDTLHLSPLFFPNKPYHRLIKDYRLASDHLNNPVADSGLAKEVLLDCLDAWYRLPEDLQFMLAGLLKKNKNFRAFFKLINKTDEPGPEAFHLVRAIRRCFGGKLCQHTDLETLITRQPVQLAYVLSLLYAPDAGSIIPPWLLFKYPDLPEIMHQLRAEVCDKPTCNYCRQYASPIAGLRRFFGYEAFRKFSPQEETPLQQEVVEAALRGESLLAIFPTGGGKSLTFQLPALMRGEANRGLTVIISPLQALMKDQVDVLAHRFDITNAVYINGLLSPLERADAIEKVREGGANLLYIAPESLRSRTILGLLKGRYIERFVVDEAHCFSAWGQDFRVDYLYIGRFLKELAAAKGLAQPIPVSCFTATAKPEVIGDIQHYFRQQANLTLNLYQTLATRQNLSYFASEAAGKEVKLQKLQNLLTGVTEPCIVYVSRTKTAMNVAETLVKSGLKAAAYHGRMEADDKIKTQDAFMRGETDIIVATSAFGMGVDKENVKMVVHYDISDSLENYLQEAGRAGRKADLEAHCHLLFDEDDLNAHFNLLNQTKITQKEISQIWKAVKDFKRTRFTKSALEIAKQAGWETDTEHLETQVKAAIAALEDVGYVRREQNSPRIFAQSILVKNVEAANKIIRAHPDRFPGQLEQQAIRVFQYLISRDDTHTDHLADHLGIEQYAVVRILTQFKDLGLLGDTKDLTAFINPARSQKSSERCYSQSIKTEAALLNILLPSDEAAPVMQTHLRDLNEKLLQQGGEGSSVEVIRNLLQYWEHESYIRKERLEAQTLYYRISFRVSRATLLQDLQRRQELAGQVVRWLCEQNALLIAAHKKPEETALPFSLVEMQKSLYSGLLQVQADLVEYEKVLLYLHFICAIKLEGGLFVLYNPMTLVRVEENPLKRYTRENYAKLERHYEKKTEQIHIIGEYARKQLTHHLDALQFVEDYFRLPYDDFLQKYFRGQRGKLKQPITEGRFREIFGALSEEQLAVVKDQVSPNILVGAGPGSGKTRVLVHKVAALLLMEDIKPDQFLMLTFSRPAALEFKERLVRLIGSPAYYIDIHTYHGYAFQLLGRVGDLQKSENVIEQATLALQQETIATDRVKSKSVLVVDEYQDISQQEYNFLQTITQLADDVRVIVVGDDDQNIYEFRGSSVAFMRRFRQERQAKAYYLTRNYRAAANLVSFSNGFLGLFGTERLKAHLPLLPHQTQNGTIQLTHHQPASCLVLPVVRDLVGQKLTGTTAVLTPTNQEALLVQQALREQNIPARLILAHDGYALRQLLELRCFGHYAHAQIKPELGYITAAAWQAAKDRVAREFAASANLPLVMQVIETYERASPERRYWHDWQAYLHEVKAEDFFFPDADKVLVSTMHKAKGKEFDHVFLLLQNYPLSSEDRKRVVYVALTRARQSLHLHTDQTYFNHLQVPQLTVTTDTAVYPAPATLRLETGLNDIWLNLFRQPATVKAVKSLRAGDKLRAGEDLAAGLCRGDGKLVVKFSGKFKERLMHFKSQGYSFSSAEVAQVVVWWCQEDSKEYRVVLPRVELRKD